MNLTDKEFDWITTGLALLSLKPKLHGDSAGVMDLYSRLVVDRKAPPCGSRACLALADLHRVRAGHHDREQDGRDPRLHQGHGLQ